MKRNAFLVLALISVLLAAAAQASDDKRPRPTALRIGFDESFGPYGHFRLSQNFSQMKTFLETEFGATVTANYAGWGASAMSNYDIYILVGRWQVRPSDSDCYNLRNWIQNGGCLILCWHPFKEVNYTYADQNWPGKPFHLHIPTYYGMNLRATPASSVDITSISGQFNSTPRSAYHVAGNFRSAVMPGPSGGAIVIGRNNQSEVLAAYNPNPGGGSVFVLGSLYFFQNTFLYSADNANFLYNIIDYCSNGGNGGGGLPDLFVKKLKGKPKTVAVGQQLKIKARIKNKGGSASAATTVNFYLSPDATYDATDILLGSETVPALNKNKSKKVKKTVLIPSVAPGTYYIIAIVDPGDTVAESDETNNTKTATKVITVI